MADQNLNEIIMIKADDWNTLDSTGEVVIGGVTLRKDPGTIYITDKIKSQLVDDTNCTNKFVKDFVDNGSTVTMTIDGVTFTLAKVQ